MTQADPIQCYLLWIQGAMLVVQILALIGLGLYVRYTRQLRDAAERQIKVSLETQRQASESQRSVVEHQNFETKYFELIKMHRENVTEITVQTVSGRKFFVWLIRELRCALAVVRRIAETSGLEMTQRQALHVAYYCLFFGVGPNSSRMLRTSLPEFSAEFIDSVERELNKQETKETARKERNFPYTPFEGHQSRLGHYYRHLYQMVRYVDQQKLDIDKYEYVKTIRAQLSTHEQVSLLVNTLTPMGQDWWLKGLLVKYRLVQNIPLGFFESAKEFDPATLFNAGYFEWEDLEAGRSSDQQGNGQPKNRPETGACLPAEGS